VGSDEEESDQEMDDDDVDGDEEFQAREEDAESQVADDCQSVAMSEMDTASSMFNQFEDVAANEDELSRFRDERSHEMFPVNLSRNLPSHSTHLVPNTR